MHHHFSLSTQRGKLEALSARSNTSAEWLRYAVMTNVDVKLHHVMASETAADAIPREARSANWMSHFIVNSIALNPFNASCSKLLLFEGFSARLV